MLMKPLPKKVLILGSIGLFCAIVIFNMRLFPWRTPAEAHLETEEKFKEKMECSLQSVFPVNRQNSRSFNQRLRKLSGFTLDFLQSRLFQKFREYNILSPVEQIHFLTQVFQETDNLIYTVEKAGLRTWNTVLSTSANLTSWNCHAYHQAMIGDKSYFDNRYDNSRNSYKAKFRGRGLIHLTHCYNYLKYFYHRSAVKLHRSNLAQEIGPEILFLDDNIGLEKSLAWNTFCSDATLASVANFFREEGLLLEPSELINDFENTLNILAIPCTESKVSNISSLEFLVDSSINYWRKCQSQYSNDLRKTDGRAIAQISECVHGYAWGLYNTFTESYCNEDGSSVLIERQKIKTERRWILDAYCARLKKFRDIQGCFL